jgi:hypothetical protein
MAPSRLIEIIPPSDLSVNRGAAGGGGGRGGTRGGGGGGGRGGGFGAGTPAAPPPTTWWRILPSGTVERTTDAGASWQPVSIDQAARVTGGAAASASVCWLIGQSGIVFRSTDGAKFDRVVFPETADLTSIRVTDADHASVTTVDGRTFTTTDGGVTWQRLQGFLPSPF